MNASMWKAIAIALSSGLLGAGAAFAFARAEPAPQPHTQLADAEWLPKEGEDPRVALASAKDRPDRIDYSAHPTAFPDVRETDAYLERDWRAWRKVDERALTNLREKFLESYCPRLYGLTEITIEPTDDLQQKLLKARLHQTVMSHAALRKRLAFNISSVWYGREETFDCLTDVHDTTTKLWANQPKELIPWLEECVVIAKEMECKDLLRVINGIAPPRWLNATRRHRLKAEAELWKVKNAK